MIRFLHPEDPFPPLAMIRDDLGGLLAIGGDLSPERLLTAYRQGIFPWGTVDGQPLWYNPQPRMVMRPAHFRPRRSLQKVLRQQRYEVRLDHDFAAVIRGCAATPRPGQAGTWITDEMLAAYLRLHRLGWAHAIETWLDGELAGGLYGLAIGRMFFGESMFSWRPDASKIAFAHLCRHLADRGIELIDCQMHTPHLASLGASEMPRAEFLAELARLTGPAPEKAALTAGKLRYDW